MCIKSRGGNSSKRLGKYISTHKDIPRHENCILIKQVVKPRGARTRAELAQPFPLSSTDSRFIEMFS